MHFISELYPDFFERFTLCKEVPETTDPFIALSDKMGNSRADGMAKYLTRYGWPRLLLPMIPEHRFLLKDPKLPIVYANLSIGGTLTAYTSLPIGMSQVDCIGMAERLGVNRLHWIILDHTDFEGLVSKASTTEVSEIINPSDVWEKIINAGILPPSIENANLMAKVEALRKVNLPPTHALYMQVTAISSQYPVLSTVGTEQNEDLHKLFSIQTLIDYHICPLSKFQNNIVLAVAQRLDTPTKQTIKNIVADTSLHFQCILIPDIELRRSISALSVILTTQQINAQANFGDDYIEETEFEQYRIDPEDVRRRSSDTVITAQTFLDSLLMQGVQENASDIHISMLPRGVRIRFRINGILKDITQAKPVPHEMGKQLLARIQVLSRIDTQHKDLPQDGQFKFKVQDLPCEVRVNSSENINGLHIVMRLQIPSAKLQDLETLGIDPYELNVVHEAIDADNGMMIICGPTGSGKSTTLYAALKAVDRVKYNVLTAEQPVERVIPNVEQTNIVKGSPYTFSEFIVAAMRQDPDYLLIGETRDRETATEIVRAAITGHVVLTTLHTNSAALAPARLIDLTGEPYLLADSLTALCAQRLLPRLCPYCMEKISIPPAAKLRDMNIKEEWLMGASHFYRSRGCSHCNYTGRVSRLCIMEAFLINPYMRELIAKQAPVRALVKAQTEAGSQQLYEKAIRKVARGEVALDDALPLKLTGVYD